VRSEAENRQATHTTNSSQRLYSADPLHENRIGALAEFAFAHRYGLAEPEPWVGSRGDQGYDFKTYSGLTIDVKGSHKKPYFMPAKIADLQKPHGAECYVLAWVPTDREQDVVFMGWAWKAEILRKGVLRRAQLPIDFLAVMVEDLRSMESLTW
jgi:hypothetical protein